MARTTKTKLEQATSDIKTTAIEQAETTNNVVTGSENANKSIEITNKESEVNNNFSVLLEAQAKKLSPKSEGHITFQLIKSNDDVISLQLLANTSGGNFSKTPVSLKTIIEVLAKQSADRAFKSSIIKDVFTGKGSESSNNSAFMISALRATEIGLIVPNDKSKFLSNLSNDFEAQSKKLLSL
jgi:hypothetical protein